MITKLSDARHSSATPATTAIQQARRHFRSFRRRSHYLASPIDIFITLTAACIVVLHLTRKHGQHNCHQRQRDGKGSTLHGAANRAIEERHGTSLHTHSPYTGAFGVCLQVSCIGRGPGADAPFHSGAARRAANRLCSGMPSANRRHAFLKEQEAW